MNIINLGGGILEKENSKLLRGVNVSTFLTENTIKDVDSLRDKGIIVNLAMVRVGNNEEDIAYERAAINRCKKCGIETKVVELDRNISQDEYISVIEDLNKDESVHGILCFRPLPRHIDEEVVQQCIDYRKDVDCFSPINMGKIMYGDEDVFPPCTAKAVVDILDYYNINLRGKKVAILGRSLVVGKPLSFLLLNRDATVTICHSKTDNLREITSNSDIVISCIGKPRIIDKSYIKEDTVVIDVGINFDENGNMCGDVDIDSVIDAVSLITPVPGGVGTVTTSVLANVVVKVSKNLIRG